MKYIFNSIKAIIVCALVNAIYTFYTASSVFMLHATSAEKDMGRFKLFIHNSEITDNFWPHVINGWGYGFGLSLASCLLLLLWLHLKTHNKAINSDRKKRAALS